MLGQRQRGAATYLISHIGCSVVAAAGFPKLLAKKKILWDYLLGICMGW